MIKLENIDFSYVNDKNVLSDFNLEVKKEEIIGVLGHNGAGKTTLFRIILGLIAPNYGSIKINNETNYSNSYFRGYISYMPENDGIYDKLNAYENLKFRAGLSKVDTKKTDEYSKILLQKLCLIEKANEKVGVWSNGMKKRLSFACSLISNPKVLLLDEPTNGLDPESLDIISKIISEQKRSGATILINSHDLNTIKELCDRIIIIQNGKKIYDGEIDSNISSLKEFYLQMTGKE